MVFRPILVEIGGMDKLATFSMLKPFFCDTVYETEA